MSVVTEEAGTALGRLIREQGRLKGWVAEQLGIGPERLSRLISGERELTLREAARLAEIFGVAIETFVPSRGVGA
ncbi:MAG: helix-turn-helix transcriptional regulator [Chloroflexi bacterium]|nr:helix-turn-helix transcriptional regulator [Chloroflexota bacterium]